jgi:V/A-type H+-transporting ATPase subunit C
MTGTLTKYAFINAKLRARISKILPDEMFRQLGKTATLEAALAMLRDTPFARLETIYAETGDFKKAELEMLKEEIDLYTGIRRYLHENSRQVVDALLLQFEIDNLKNAIRVYFDRKIRKTPDETIVHYIIYEPIVHHIPMDLVLNAESFDEIAGVCKGTPYSEIIRNYGRTVESEGSLFRLEIALDHFYYENLLSAVDKLDSRDREIALRLIGVEIDLQNISWTIRFRNFYDMPAESVMASLIPGGFSLSKGIMDDLYRSQNVTAVLGGFIRDKYPLLSTLLSAQTTDSMSRLILIRRVLEEIRKQEVRHIMAGYPFTIGIILAYFLLKRDELKKLRMTLIAKQYGKVPEKIEGMI